MAQDRDVIVSVSGLRGMIGRGLTPELVSRFAAAFGTHLGGGCVVVGRDSRPSGQMLQPAVVAGLISVGCDVIDAGIVPTPTCGRAVAVLGAAGGIQITASHNPAEWNGLKLFGPDGAVLTADQGRQVQRMFAEDCIQRVAWDQLGRQQPGPDAVGEHLARVLNLANVPLIQQRGFRVLLDANGGAGGPAGRRLLEALGCTVVPVGCEPNGDFAHEPEPVPEHLTHLAPYLRAAGCELGFVLDPDADRLAILDADGQPIGEELTLALAARYRLSQELGSVVINLSTSRVTEDVARLAGVTCERSAVGEANVVERMRQIGALMGGEGNGGVIDPRVGWVRDAFIGMALILESLAMEQRTLAELVAGLPSYSIVKEKVAIAPQTLPEALNRLTQHWPGWRADRRDGLRLDGPEGWVQVRASNTEPVVRVIAEAGDRDAAGRLCEVAGRLLAG